MGIPIAYLKDNFNDNIIAPLWLTWPTAYNPPGSATRSEASGQAQIALPSSVAGTHVQAFYSAATYDMTDTGSFGILTFNIAQMVSTSVAATAILGLISDNQSPDGSTVLTNQIRWIQASGTLKAQKYVAGVATDIWSATWNATNHKYLRFTVDSTSIYFLTSANGTSWTEQADITLASLGFAITDLHVFIYAECGNVASPGTLKIEEINPLSLSTNWRWTQVVWSLQHRFRSITLAGNNKVAYIAASQDGVTWRYFAGPLGSASGLYNQLVEYGTQAEAEAMATDVPHYTLGLGRWDLPAITECRYFRLYHRSLSGTGTLYEFYPRRLVQADDIEAEKIRAIHIAANSITADRMSVIKLSAITANIGQLIIDTNGYIFQGTGSGTAAENAASPTTKSVTGLKIYHSGGIGILSTYNAGVEQIKLDTDGRFKAGAGNVVLDAGGMHIIANTSYGANRSIKFYRGTTLAAEMYTLLGADFNQVIIQNNFNDTTKAGVISLSAYGFGSGVVEIVLDASGTTKTLFMTAEEVEINGLIVTESYIAPSFSNSWVNYGSVYSIAGYYKDKFGIVHLRGLIKSGTINAAAFTLPSGYRPAYRHMQATVSNNGAAEIISRIDVDTNGDVIPVTGSNTYFSLDGISFRAA